ncbi:MAG: DUF2759 family protein [Alicyclobacillus sp.]|nr:DUF2759 family protein [Alicyclobacillus sp.]
MNQYLHPYVVAFFLLVFTVMSVIGMVRLFRQRNAVGTVLLLLSTLIFGYSTWIAATLQS